MKGVYFGNLHSYRDLNLILAPFTPPPATPKTNFLSIPGRDGFLDLTEANGEVKFNSLEFQMTFTIAPGDDLTFDERVSKVSDALNGVQCQITFDRDPDFYWVGRCAVNKYKQDKNVGKIVVNATVNPYKLKKTQTEVEFELSSELQTITVENGRMSVIPEIVVSSMVSFWMDGMGFTLNAGTWTDPRIRLVAGTNYFSVSGSGTLLFRWQEGAL